MLATTVFNLSDLNDQLRVIVSNPKFLFCQISFKPNPIILIFNNQTARSVNLNKHVYDTSVLLRKYLDECDEMIKKFEDRGIYSDIFETKPIDNVVIFQTMQFAIQYACAQSWIACGLRIDCVLGHSLGQLIALNVADTLSVAEGFKLIYGRAILMRDKWGPEMGFMIVLEVSHDDVMKLVSSVRKASATSDSELEVACINEFRSLVLIESSAEIDVVFELTKKTSMINVKILNVTHGFHSKFCDLIAPDLKKLAQGLKFNELKIYVETCFDENT